MPDGWPGLAVLVRPERRARKRPGQSTTELVRTTRDARRNAYGRLPESGWNISIPSSCPRRFAASRPR